MFGPMSNPIPRLNAALDGRYSVERELGQGGMATVYLARHLLEHSAEPVLDLGGRDRKAFWSCPGSSRAGGQA